MQIRLVIVALLIVVAGGRRAVAAEEAATTRPMSVGQSIVLGVVEGLTEYLPVSSTGHLILTQRAMGIGGEAGASDEEARRAKDAADAFAICIQGGAILAVLGLYWKHVLQMMLGLIGKSPHGRRMLINLVAGVLPAVVLGLALESTIKRYLFGLWPIVIAWAVGGVLIIGVSVWRQRRRRAAAASGDAVDTTADDGLTMEQLTWRRAMVIGFLQCIAMWPGTSRSLMTIVGGVLVGMRLSAAVEFSFLLGVATLGGATLKDAVQFGPLMWQVYGPVPLFVGAAAAFASAVIAVKWMVAYLNKHGLTIFGWYRIALAAVVAVLLWRGVIAAV